MLERSNISAVLTKLQQNLQQCQLFLVTICKSKEHFFIKASRTIMTKFSYNGYFSVKNLSKIFLATDAQDENEYQLENFEPTSASSPLVC